MKAVINYPRDGRPKRLQAAQPPSYGGWAVETHIHWPCKGYDVRTKRRSHTVALSYALTGFEEREIEKGDFQAVELY